MRFSWDAAWTDVQALWRGHGEVLMILAGLFVMVPQFAVTLFFPLELKTAFDPSNPAAMDAIVAEVGAYFSANWPGLLLANLVVLLGTSTILMLMLDHRRPTVGEALAAAAMMLPSLFVLNALRSLIIYAGLLLLIVPGLYLLGRLAVTQAWQVAHRGMNPLTSIARSFQLTRGNGWTIAFFLIVIVIVAWVANAAMSALIGIVLSVVIPKASLGAVMAFVAAVLQTAVILATLLFTAAIYRQLAPRVG